MRCANSLDVLYAKIEEWRTRPFAYGSVDCCQFPADVVLALTGVDFREQFPTYATQEEAAAILATHGGMVGLLTSVLGEPVHVSRAKRGGVIACDFGDGIAAGICLGVKCCAPGARGLVERQTLDAVAAWSI